MPAAARLRCFVVALAAVAAVAAVAACRRRAPPAPPRVLAHVAVGSSPTRADASALYFLDERGAVRAAEGGVRRVPLRSSGCVDDGERLAVFELVPLGDGRRAVALDSAANAEFDLFGHSGRHLAIHCLVDFERGVAGPVESSLPTLHRAGDGLPHGQRLTAGASGRFYRAALMGPLVAIDRATGAELPLTPEREDDRRCELAEAASELTVVCPVETFDRAGNFASRVLRMARFNLGSPLLERTGEATSPIALRDLLDGLAVSPDGRVAVYWGSASARPVPSETHESTVSAASVADGRARFTERTTLRGSVVSAAALPDERGVLVGERIDHRGRLRWLRLDGTAVRTWELDEVPWHLHATARADRAWVVGTTNAVLLEIVP